MPIKPLIDASTIAQRVAALGAEISRDYAGNDIVVVPVLKGSYVFAADLVRQIDLGVEVVDQDTLHVTPPGFRVDLEREVDLTEEIARLTGYDAIPETLPEDRVVAAPRRHGHTVRARARQVMAGRGYAEVISYSFVAPGDADLLRLPPDHPGRRIVPLLNPASPRSST